MTEYDGIESFEKDFTKKFDDAADELLQQLVDAANKHWRALAKQRLQATAQYYDAELRVEAEADAVQVTVPKGIPSAVDAGTNGFNLARGFLSPRSKTLLLERAPGNIRWIPLRRGNKARAIPLDGGWPEKRGNNWNHPGIAPRNISTDATEKIRQEVIPELIKSFVAKVSI